MRALVPFGKYILLERISVGGMAEVYKAKVVGGETYDPVLAIKRILPSIAEDADFIQMFIDEARIAGQLHHPHIAQIFELGAVGASHFIAMEYVWGKDLLQIQNRFRKLKSRMSFPMAAYCAMKICEALDYAHKKQGTDGNSLGIIHRDVSPQNVLVSYEGDVKVIDFGIAKAAARSTQTQAGVLKGKFGYMSPEQVSGQAVDRRSDVFAIGTVLFELITADRLFLGESDFATLEKVRNVDVPLPSVAAPGCPPELERIIRKGLSRDVEQRYAWASEMGDDLRAWLASLPEPFTPRQLSDWMQSQFAVERKREAQGLTEQLQTFEDMKRGVGLPPVPVDLPSLVPSGAIDSMGAMGAMAPMSSERVEAPPGREEYPGEPTKIIPGATSAPGAGVDGAAAGAHSGDVAARDREGTLAGLGGPDPSHPPTGDAPRSPYGSAAGGLSSTESAHGNGHNGHNGHSGSGAAHHAGASLPSPGSGVVEADGEGEMPSQATKIVDTASLIAAVPSPIRPVPAPSPQLEIHPPTSNVRMPPSGAFRAQRSTFTKDLLLGLAISALLVAVVVGARMYSISTTMGTLVVTTVPPSPAMVLIDGLEQGHLSAGRVLTLKGISVGSHNVRVSAEAGEFEETVTLAPGDVSVVSAMLHPRKGQAPVAAAVTGAGVGEGLADHTPGAATERPARDGGVLPSRLIVRSTPSGAEVNLNGRPVGLSPVDASDLQPDGLVRVTVRKRGYATVIRYLNFDAVNRDQSLDITLLVDPASEKGPGEKGQAAPQKNDKAAAGDGKTNGAATKTAAKDEKKGDAGDKKADGGGKKAAASDGKTAQKSDGAAAGGDGKSAEPAKDDKAKAAAAPAPNGYLVANSQPSARVLVDNKDTGQTTPIPPKSKLPLTPGKHVVTFVLKGKKWNFDIEVKSGEDYKLIKTLSD